MKYLSALIFSVFCVCFPALIFASGLDDQLSELKSLSRNLESSLGFTNEFTVKADPEAENENVLFEVFDYISEMQQKYPSALPEDTISKLKKNLSEIQSSLSQLSETDASSSADVIEQISRQRDDILETLFKNAPEGDSQTADDTDFEYCDTIPEPDPGILEDFYYITDAGDLITDEVASAGEEMAHEAEHAVQSRTKAAGGGKGEEIAKLALALNGKSGKTVYGVTCYTATTEWGNKACAAVVSAVLKKAGCVSKINLACVGLRADLKKKGWKDIGNKFEKGDVCYWTKSKGDRPRHVGIIVQKDGYGKFWTIDNSSGSKKVLKRPLKRSYYPVILPGQRK